jgi:ubiquinone/menaquinone biosynthesis C-methylase UbiE
MPPTIRQVDYDEHQHAVYAKGRLMTPARLTQWMQVFAREAPARRPLSVLDLGSGIGRLAPALAQTFGGPVFGVEPSAKMRAIALAQSPHAGVQYLDGAAEHIPLPDASVDLALMFLSFHHFRDRAAAAQEVVRVLRPDGCAIVRSTFSGRVPDFWWRRFFPRTWEIEDAVFPTVDEAIELFAAAGLTQARLSTVVQPFAETVEAEAERLRLRALSIFEHMDEAELAEDFARMDAALAAGQVDPPPPTPFDMLVLRR